MSRDRQDALDCFAAVLRYPDPDYLRRTRECLRTGPSEVTPLLEDFVQRLQPLSLHQLEELFLQTFDLNPVCSLEVGWHLFGENYDRGLLLVRIRQELARCGVPESSELPDHLTHVLGLLGRMPQEPAADFAAAVVLPALAKMLEAMHGKENPYENLLEAIRRSLHLFFPEIPASASQTSALRVLPEGALVR